MSRRHRLTRPPRAVTVRIVACCTSALTLTVLALTGCGAGQITQTDNQVSAVGGTYGGAGPRGGAGQSIALRDVLIPYPQNPQGVYPAGSSVPVLLTIINQGDSPDELVAVTTPAAGQVQVEGTTMIPPGMSVISTSGSTGSTPSAQPTSPLVAGQLRIMLTTTQPLHAGLNTPVTFLFRNAGKVTLPVPMAALPDSAGESVRSAEPVKPVEPGGHA